MADVPWEKGESQNYICMQNIVTDVVSEGLRKVFKAEWNSRFQASLGAWDDTRVSGTQLFNNEKSRKRPTMKVYQSEFQHGDTNQWDCSTLFDAILYSNSIGSILNAKVKNEVDKLRVIRNKIMHAGKATLTDAEFETMTGGVENSFKALGLPIDDVIGIKTKRNLYKSFEVLPPKPTHGVVYRSEKINEMKKDLQKLRNENNGKLTYFYVSGNPGSGKSQLSRQLGEDLYKSVDCQANTAYVMTLDAKNLDSLLYSYEYFCRRLNCNEDVREKVMNSSKPKEEKIKELRSQIMTRIRNWKLWWIIVDNVEDLKLISPLLPQIGDKIWNNGQIIVTIQNTFSVPSDSLDTKHVSLSGGMNEQECQELLSTLSGTDVDDPLLNKVAKKLDHQPLAMAAAAVYLQQLKERKFSWSDYLEKLEKGKRHVTEKRLQETNPAYSSTMSAAVLLAVQKSAENDFILNQTFKLFALISFEPLPIDIIVKYIQQLEQTCEKEEIYLAIKHCSLFLLTENENDVRLHRVVHEATKLFSNGNEYEIRYSSQNETVNEKERILNVAKALYCFKDRDDKIKILPHLKSFNAVDKKLLSQQDLLDSNGSDLTKMYIFFGQILRHSYHFKLAVEFLQVCLEVRRDSDRDLFDVFCELGEAHYDLGECTKSKDYHEQAIAIATEEFGPNHIKVGRSCNNLGLVYQDIGQLDLAKDYYERAIEISTNVLGRNHADAATSYDNLGSVYHDMAKLVQAKHYHQQALEIRKKVLGPNHLDVSISYNNLALVYQDMGQLDLATDYHKRAMEISTKELGPNHIDAATSYDNLGSVLHDMGKLEQAKNYHQQALEIRKMVLGPNHLDVGTSYNNLGLVHHDMGNLEQAKDYHQQAIAIATKEFGPYHIGIATSYDNLGLVYLDMDELEQAKDYHQRAMEIGVNVLGPNHIDVATSYNNLGLVYHKMSELQQAEAYHLKAMEIRKEVLGPNHIDVATSYSNLGLVYHKMDKLEKAEAYHLQAMEIRKEVLGPNHIDVATSYSNLGLVYHKMDELEKAEVYHLQAMEIRKEALGPNHIDVAASYSNLGLVYHKMNELEKAEAYHLQAMEIRKEVLGPNHIDVATSYSNLGLVYHKMDELEKAKDYHQRAMEIRIKDLGHNHIDVSASYENLSSVYAAMGELEQAGVYGQRAIEIGMRD